MKNNREKIVVTTSIVSILANLALVGFKATGVPLNPILWSQAERMLSMNA